MNETVNRLLERQAERRRRRRIRTIENVASAALAAACMACLIHMEVTGHAEAKDTASVPVVPVQAAFGVEPEPAALTEAKPMEEPEAPAYIIEYIPLPEDLQTTLHDAAEEFGADYYIMLALIEQESDYRNITGDGGDSIGYCQIQPKWWTGLMEEIGATDLTDPEDNFRTACAILAGLADKHGSVEYALTAYNRGTPGESEYAREVVARAEVISGGHDQ